MKADRALLQPLRLPAVVLMLTLAASAILLYATGEYSGAMEEERSTLQAQLGEVARRAQQARNQEASFRTDAVRFEQLLAQGIRGPQQRLAWVHLMDSLPAECGLGQSDYQISAEHPYARIAAEEGGMLRIDASQVHWQGDAAHEGRLLDFIAALEARAPGLLGLRSCAFESPTEVVGDIHASCVFDWMTLEP